MSDLRQCEVLTFDEEGQNIIQKFFSAKMKWKGGYRFHCFVFSHQPLVARAVVESETGEVFLVRLKAFRFCKSSQL